MDMLSLVLFLIALIWSIRELVSAQRGSSPAWAWVTLAISLGLSLRYLATLLERP